MAFLGHITPEVVDIFLSEAADLLGQWDEACFSLENDGDPREALLWISRCTQSLRRASRGMGLEEFAHTLNSTEEYVRLVLRASVQPGPEVARTLSLTHGVMSRWVVGLRTDAYHTESLEEVNDSIRVQKAAVQALIDNERAATQVRSLSTDKVNSDELEDEISQNANQDSGLSQLENADWDVVTEAETRVDELIHLTGKLSAYALSLHASTHANEMNMRSLRQHLNVSSGLIEQLCHGAVDLKKVPITGLLEKLAAFAVESAQSKGCSIQFDYEGQGVLIDKKLIAKLWEPLSKIVRWMIEHSFEDPEDRVKAGKLPMGFLRIQALSKGNLISVVFEDDGLGQGDGDATPQGLLLKNFVDSVRSQLRSVSATLAVDAHLGRSTRVELVFPASLWMMELVHVMCSQRHYVLPLHTVQTLIDPGTFSTHVLRGEKQLVEHNGKLYPFVTLTEVIEKTPLTKRRVEQAVAIEKGFVALVRYGRDTVAVGIDAVYETSTRIVHPLQQHLAQVRGLFGTVIDATGEPIFAVDLLEVIDSFLRFGTDREAA